MKNAAIILALYMICSMHIHAQTFDPYYFHQYYIEDHRIDEVWNWTQGSHSTRIAIHSGLGFTTSHEDLTGSRFLIPFTYFFNPQNGYATELAGIVGANTNNNKGIAGINWNAKIKSYNFIDYYAAGEPQTYLFTVDGVDYDFSVDKMNRALDQAASDNMDIQLFTYGVPTSKVFDLRDINQNQPSLSSTSQMFHAGPKLQSPHSSFMSGLSGWLTTIGQSIWSSITSGNDFIPAPATDSLRYKLYTAATQDNNVLVAAVGDIYDGKPPAPILMPFAFDDYVIGVGGLEKVGDTYQYWSQAGTSPFVDVSVAATDIFSTNAGSYTAYNADFSSTHASSAIVAGVVSLLQAYDNSLSYDDYDHILKNTALDIGDSGKDPETGYGMVDAKAALDYMMYNDIVRKSVAVTSFSQTLNPYSFGMDNAYKFSTPYPQAHSVTGKINTITGRVDFDKIFSTTPDVWLRNTTSGTDVSPIGGTQYYEPYDKSIRIVQVDRFGFTFELETWEISAYVGQYSLVGKANLPNLNNLTVAYTAVGNETDYIRLTSSISGDRSILDIGELGTWTASANGNSPYNYSWHVKPTTSSSWQYLGGSTQVTTSFASPGHYILRLTTNDVSGQSSVSEFSIIVNEHTGGGCSDPTLPCKQVGREKIELDYVLNQNYPNPFNPLTNVRFSLKEASNVQVDIYNIMGQHVTQIVNQHLNAGQYTFPFDGTNVSSGMYLTVITAVDITGAVFRDQVKMQLLK